MATVREVHFEFDGKTVEAQRGRHRGVGALSRRPAHFHPQLQISPAARPAVPGGQVSELPDERGRRAQRAHLHHAGARRACRCGTRTRIRRSIATGCRCVQRFDWLMPVGWYYKTMTHPRSWHAAEPYIRKVAGLGDRARAGSRLDGLRARVEARRSGRDRRRSGGFAGGARAGAGVARKWCWWTISRSWAAICGTASTRARRCRAADRAAAGHAERRNHFASLLFRPVRRRICWACCRRIRMRARGAPDSPAREARGGGDRRVRSSAPVREQRPAGRHAVDARSSG